MSALKSDTDKVFPAKPDGRFHLAIRLPDGVGFAISWADQATFYQMLNLLAESTNAASGVRDVVDEALNQLTRPRA